VEDVFNIEGRGTVATGVSSAASSRRWKKSSSSASVRRKTTVTDIEMFRKLLDEARAGDNVGLLLRGTRRDDVERAWSSQAGSIKAHKKFKAEIYVLSKEEGGRHTPFFLELSPAVLLPHHGRDRFGQPPGWG